MWGGGPEHLHRCAIKPVNTITKTVMPFGIKTLAAVVLFQECKRILVGQCDTLLKAYSVKVLLPAVYAQ